MDKEMTLWKMKMNLEEKKKKKKKGSYSTVYKCSVVFFNPPPIPERAILRDPSVQSPGKMTDFQGKCHCGNTEWTATLQKDQQAHILCHCNTCKELSGSTFTLNQIIPAKALKITKGDDLGKYTYKGDSGTSTSSPHPPSSLHINASILHSNMARCATMLTFSAGRDVHCYYCKVCTSHVYHQQEALGPDSIVLRTGLLTEGIQKFQPGAEIFGKDRLSWEKEVAQTFDGMPPS
ncbi:hypothetical protein IAQ61_010774 [Plenodomus lingam]|uniref:uncharacterized protein n=1 Tax=Leptosphaeria maculans TaxID=5022 RepID=UPI00331E7BF2|nr:hypothetical protein IAQ61_010774 [Plenodomus lingam]